MLPFLDALDALSPAYEALGMMFAVASKEITGNSKKLRAVFEELQQRSHAGRAAGESNESGLFLAMGGGSSDYAATTSLQDLMLAVAPTPPVHPTTPAAEAAVAAVAAAGQRGFDRGLTGGGAAALRVPPTDVYEAGRWLFFALHMMELLYGCVGEGGAPGHCASVAYDQALKPHQNFAMRTLAAGVLRLVPNSAEGLRERTGLVGSDAQAFNGMMARWSLAVAKPRRALEAFFAQWPPHKG